MHNLNSKQSDVNSSQDCKQNLCLVSKYRFCGYAKLKLDVLLKYAFIIRA